MISHKGATNTCLSLTDATPWLGFGYQNSTDSFSSSSLVVFDKITYTFYIYIAIQIYTAQLS